MAIAIESIKAMLEAVQQEQKTIEARLETLEERESTLRAWLAEEQSRQGSAPPDGTTEGTALSNFLRSVLADGKAHDLNELSSMAKARGGLVKENASPGRVVHFALLGMQQHGYVTRTSNGKWTKAAQDPISPTRLQLRFKNSHSEKSEGQ
jgi:DNA-binding transcriptional MerR regulator